MHVHTQHLKALFQVYLAEQLPDIHLPMNMVSDPPAEPLQINYLSVGFSILLDGGTLTSVRDESGFC